MVDYFTMRKAIRASKEEAADSLEPLARESDRGPWYERTHRVDDAP